MKTRNPWRTAFFVGIALLCVVAGAVLIHQGMPSPFDPWADVRFIFLR